MSWTDTNVDKLRLLMSEGGLSCSQIAAEIGCGFTRNAIVGKCHRLGIKIPGNHYRGPMSREKKIVERRTRQRRAAPELKVALLVSRQTMPAEPAMLAEFQAPPLPDGSVTLLGLTNETCRWPLLECSPQLYCGALADLAGGFPYCKAHTVVATGGAPPRPTRPYRG